MKFELYGDDTKGIVKLDPRTKMMIFFSGMILSTFCFNAIPYLVFSTGLCLVLALCGKKWFAVKCYFAIIVFQYLRYAMAISRTGSSVVIGILNGLIMIFMYSMPMVLSLVLLIQTTRISQFLSSLTAMHLPLGMIIAISVLLRFIPTVKDEWIGVRKAMAFRGISLEPGAIVRAPLKTIEYILIPLLFSCISVMDELASASLARGLDAKRKRTSYEEVKLRVIDYIVMSVFLIIDVYVIIYGRA